MKRGPEKFAVVAGAALLGAAAVRATFAEVRAKDELRMAMSVVDIVVNQRAEDAAAIARLEANDEANTVMLAMQSERMTVLEKEAVIDELTNIPNRRGFAIAFGRLRGLARSQAHTQDQRTTPPVGGNANPSSIVLFDIDHFKSINDTRGHAGGDLVLQTFAGLLANRRPTDVPARLGGEEFALLLPGADETIALHVAESVREEFKIATLGNTVSAGVGTIDFSDTLEANLLPIDRALYAAKAEGRDQVVSAHDLPGPGL